MLDPGIGVSPKAVYTHPIDISWPVDGVNPICYNYFIPPNKVYFFFNLNKYVRGYF
jgi:hypothetical protein